MAILAWAGIMSLGIANIYHVKDGLGAHTYDLPHGKIIQFVKDLWIGLLIYNVTLLFTKLTFFFQFYRIVRHTNARLRLPYIVVMSLIGCWTLAQIFVAVLACLPVAAFWDPTVKGKCISQESNRYINSVGNILTDFIILLLPVPVIWGMKMKLRQKLALAGVFGVAFCTCVISILRLVLTTRRLGASDVTFDSVPLIGWTTAELCAGIVCAALSTLRPLLGRYISGWGTMVAASARDYARFGSRGRRDVDMSGNGTATSIISAGMYLDVEEGGRDFEVEMKRPAKTVVGPRGREASLAPSGAIHITRAWSVNKF